MDCIYLVWDWFGDNSGQVQIIIALIAFWLAYVVYRKVLEQIEISNEQTYLSNKQLMISNQQMEKLNTERMFEIKLRLRVAINEQLENVIQLKYKHELLGFRIESLGNVVAGLGAQHTSMFTILNSEYNKVTSTNNIKINTRIEYLETILKEAFSTDFDISVFEKQLDETLSYNEYFKKIELDLGRVTERMGYIERILKIH